MRKFSMFRGRAGGCAEIERIIYRPREERRCSAFSAPNIIKMIFRHARMPVAASLVLMAACYSGGADARIPTPAGCPDSLACTKVVTIYNNNPKNSGIVIYPVIQAGFQDPDPWLQAAFANNGQTYAETHYSRVYINPLHGIQPGSSVSVRVPWYAKLVSDPDHDPYIDWWNGGRIVVFDDASALKAARQQDVTTPLTVSAGAISCDNCEKPLTIYSSKKAYLPSIPFQLLEDTFADVVTPANDVPYIEDLNVGYNISYLDQIYLPVALAPCRTEPCNPAIPDPTAVGYLGTTKSVPVFRTLLKGWAAANDWPRYSDPLDTGARPRLPGAYNIFTDAVSSATNPEHVSAFFPTPDKSTTVKSMMTQWHICTSMAANKDNCPQFAYYKDVSTFFTENFNKYLTLNCSGKDYPTPKTLDELSLQQYVHGWVAFNRGCGAGANPLNPNAPKPYPPFDQAKSDYLQLQYNYSAVSSDQRFNPFVELVHAKKYLDANSYAFSIDDAAGFQSNEGQGLIVAVGGAYGLPNDTPVTLPADFSKDFEINLADTYAQSRPDWEAYGICKDVADTKFSPLPPNQKNRSRTIIVDTILNRISPSNPCVVTVTDAAKKIYQLKILSAVPWPKFTSSGSSHHDPVVMSCPGGTGIVRPGAWCDLVNELSIPAEPRFALLSPPSEP